MTLAIKVVEDLPTGVADALRQAGYEAATVHEQGFTGYPDAKLWEVVQVERRLLVTADTAIWEVALRVDRPSAVAWRGEHTRRN